MRIDQTAELARLIRDSPLQWDFEEECPKEQMTETVPGLIVERLNARDDAVRDVREKTIALLASYAAERTLACWFVYCDDRRPLETVRRVISAVLSDRTETLSLDDTIKVPPRGWDGERLIDCRAQETSAASKAVAMAAKYALLRDPRYAVVSLSASYCAFNIASIGSIHTFVQWLISAAMPAALEVRPLTHEERAAHLDFPAALLERPVDV